LEESFYERLAERRLGKVFDLIGREVDLSEKDAVTRNGKKKMYVYPQEWSPMKLINYCLDRNLPPLNYAMKASIVRYEAGDVFSLISTEPALGLEHWTLDPLTIHELNVFRIRYEKRKQSFKEYR
jgi:hypothetical protein